MRVGLYLRPVLTGRSPSSLYAFPDLPRLGSVLPYPSRELGFTDFDE
ncbi:MAG TPA: hypothetical protein VFQ00_07130 [Terriglobales bacterium]|nr:hypothetical protein [Terriglobales bacterium]